MIVLLARCENGPWTDMVNSILADEITGLRVDTLTEVCTPVLVVAVVIALEDVTTEWYSKDVRSEIEFSTGVSIGVWVDITRCCAH